MGFEPDIAGEDREFWKGGDPTADDAGEEFERGGLPLTGGGGIWKGLPRTFSTFGCFLLQSRHSSALFPGLLTQDLSDCHRLTAYSDKKEKKGSPFAAGAELTATLRAQCPAELWNRPKLPNTLRVGKSRLWPQAGNPSVAVWDLVVFLLLLLLWPLCIAYTCTKAWICGKTQDLFAFIALRPRGS